MVSTPPCQATHWEESVHHGAEYSPASHNVRHRLSWGRCTTPAPRLAGLAATRSGFETQLEGHPLRSCSISPVITPFHLPSMDSDYRTYTRKHFNRYVCFPRSKCFRTLFSTIRIRFNTLRRRTHACMCACVYRCA